MGIMVVNRAISLIEVTVLIGIFQVSRPQCFHAMRENNGDAQQFNGREGETATLFVSLSVKLGVACGGFAPRHLKR